MEPSLEIQKYVLKVLLIIYDLKTFKKKSCILKRLKSHEIPLQYELSNQFELIKPVTVMKPNQPLLSG